MYGKEDVRKTLAVIADMMTENNAMLTELDAAMGDGDLGLYMERGFRTAADTAAKSEDNPGPLLKKAGMAIMNDAPSTLGTLVGILVRGMGTALPADRESFDLGDLAVMLRSGYEAMMKRGKASPGEKTILDSLNPGIEALEKALSEGAEAETCLSAAYEAALSGMHKATAMKAIHGRPSYFGDKTIGMQDGGATVGMLLFKSLLASART
ncbi:MAG: dihydroxyacetone kinase subunit DhaL [Lachnospiraceae bacterium]|nr:dihydroxyacetone kinase subunit DhaL [Lachnospiraceae bacterium]